MTEWGRRALAGLAIYKDRRIVLIALMGIASGLPLLLTLSTLTYWLRTVGVDRTTIGILALVGLPYTLKPLWAPILDQLPAPYPFARLGQRRGWAIIIQIFLMIAIAALGFTNPAADLFMTGLAVLLIAFLSASQDVVIDAFRIELLSDDEQGAGAAATQGGYRIGLLLAGAGALALSDFYDWQIVFLCLAACVPIGMIGVLLAVEPSNDSRQPVQSVKAFVKTGVIEPFVEFLARPSAIFILIFVLLYKFGDAIGGFMANPFYVDIGFTGTEIALVSKTTGVLATMIGVIVGGALVRAIGLLKALVVGGILQAVTNFLFAWVATVGPDVSALAVAVWGDNFTGGLGSAAFIAYLSALCNKEFTATQYALLTSLMAMGRTIMSTPSGYLVDMVGWAEFFILTAFLAVPGLILIAILARTGAGLSSRKAI
ncbi:AmpG family muropeptide MFS transporter [Rhodospirillaceae bacterium KN72]|uniref:AmpG family muropeptide MFS transporter n=1 Tax=Pacificispira spongiicola TaxID=2729598 RepID=A0A7Y0HGN2_9PROT|nr:MFS transporter [Pacificispira spongiicola]NMM45833.1 AmpG family muropeptide MFS transporter [Pacificispira spongiicola]